jgi:hypothetical protein
LVNVIFHPHFVIQLQVDAVTPSAPVEKTQASVSFTLENLSLAATSGAVTSNWGTAAVPVPELAAGATFRGSLPVTVPAAGSDQLRLWYTEAVQGVEFPGPAAEADTQVAVSGQYSVTVDKVHIDKTRALHNDTDYVNLILKGGKEAAMNTAWKRIGDVNDGDHGVALTLGPATVGPTDALAFAYQVINHGNVLAGVEEFFNKVSGAAAQVLGDIFVGTNWDKGDELTKFINHVQFADCDGYTAVDGIGPLDGGRLAAWTAQSGFFTLKLTYPGTNIDPETYDKLYKSADGCGGTSNYTVFTTIRRTSF